MRLLTTFTRLLKMPKPTSLNQLSSQPSTDMFLENTSDGSIPGRASSIEVCGYIFGWFFCSLCIHIYNKWLFGKENYNFPFPLFTTALHMLQHFAISCIILVYIYPSITPINHPRKTDILKRLLPCGIATGLDLGLSNSSLKVCLEYISENRQYLSPFIQ